MNGLSSAPILPAWLVLPAACVTLLVLAGYASSLQSGDVPPKRRRIRTANTLLMMFTTPVMAYAFGIVAPSDKRLFLLAWLAVTGLLAIIIMLAMMDATYSLRLHREHRRAVRQALRGSLRAAGRAGADPAIRDEQP